MVATLLQDRDGLDLILLALAVLVMPALSAFAGARLARTAADKRRLITRYWQTIARGWLVVGLIVALWRWTGRPLLNLGLDWPVGTFGRLGFALDGLAAFVLALQIMRVPKVVEGKPEKAKAILERLKITPRTAEELSIFVAMAITAGIWEELLYRGFLIWFLQPYAGVLGAIAASSLIFGLGHAYQGFRGIAATAGVGLIFALLYIASKSLWWLMLAHAVLDVYGGIAAYRISCLLRTQPPLGRD